MKDLVIASRRWLLIVCHFVGPLLFFTNLTRNPYITQIAVVQAGIALAAAVWAWGEAGRADGWRLPRLPVALPLMIFLAVWGLSWLRGFFFHVPFYRPAIVAEGARAGLFLLVVCVGTFLLSAFLASEDDGSSDVPLAGWAAFAVVWGLLWCAYPQARAPAAGRPADIWSLVWDPYGAFLWAGGLIAAGMLTRRGRVADFLHLALCAGFLASAYGVLQYFNMEIIWPYTLNPYGGRAVSTFGNPNFLSSYNIVLMPVALSLFVAEKAAPRRLVYAGVFFTLEAALLATLTRSSWAGAVAACAGLAAFPRLRARLFADSRALGLLLGTAAAMALLWPSSSIATEYTPTVIGRLTEAKSALASGVAYSPLHQRVLIWTSAWLMGSEAPALGKGGGLFELFYPFYQGHLLHQFTFFHSMRTHANNAHNEILEIFSQTGLAGLGAYLAFWTAFFGAVRRWAQGRAGGDPLWTGAAAGCGGVIVDNMLNVSMHFTVPAMMFWWAAGVVMGRGAREGAGRWQWRGSPAARRAAAAAIIAGAAGVGWIQVRMWQREAWYFEGFKFVRRGDLPAAQRALERSRAWGPREVNALYELGNVFAREAKPADAAEAYRQALDANAGYDEIFFNLATLYNAGLGRPGEALRLYETAWALNPLSNDLASALTAAYLRDPAEHRDEAIEVLRETVRNFPDNPNHWNNLGYAMSLAKSWEDAEAAFVRALSIAPELTQAERNLAGLALQSGRPRAAILAVLGDLRSLDAAAVHGDYSDRTIGLAASVSRRAPTLAKGRFLHGSLLLARGRLVEAAVELEAAVALEPGKTAARINLGNAYAALSRPTEAEAQFRAALAAEPGNPQALERLKAIGALH